MRKSLVSAGALLSVSAILLTGCTDNPKNNASSSNSSGGTSNDGNISVTSTDTACKLSATETKAGKVTFKVKNEGTKVTEFYVLGSDGLRIISEVENIGPNLTRELVVDLPEGSYKTACKPGMVGDGIQGDFKVTKNENAKPVAEDIQKLRDTASTQYASYVKDQVESLQTKTEEFAKLYAEGKTEEAKAKYALARLHYERIEPVAEKYGTSLDQNLDAREADLQEGKISEWSGWHKIEKDLWQPKADKNDGKEYTPLTQDERKKVADQLVKDTKELYDHVHSEKFAQELKVDDITNGAKELLDEIVHTKTTGEEENWSHTDLYDFQGNIDGAKVAYENVRPILEKKNGKLSKNIESKFAAVQALLDKHKSGDEFKSYKELSETEVRELSDAVGALAEPLSELTAAVVDETGNDTSTEKESAGASASASASAGASNSAGASGSASAGASGSASATGSSGASAGSSASAGSTSDDSSASAAGSAQ